MEAMEADAEEAVVDMAVAVAVEEVDMGGIAVGLGIMAA
jgi:hypothetical protein